MAENDERNSQVVLNLGVALHPVELAGWHSLNVAAMGESGETAAVWQRANAAVRIGLTECTTAALARKRLERSTLQAMRQDVPHGETLGVQLGDTSLVTIDDAGIPGAARFARGNVFVSVDRADDEPTNAVELGEAIDRMLVDPPAGSASTLQVKDGERLIVLDDLQALRGRRIHLATTSGSLIVSGNVVLYEPTDGKAAAVTLTIAD